MLDGKKGIKVFSREGSVRLERQVVYDKEAKRHFIPLNKYLPEHQGVLVTRRLQEEACLLAVDLPFDTVERLLGWEIGERSISTNTVRRIVQEQGERVARQEEQEAEELLEAGEWEGKRLHTVPHYKAARHRPGWPQELNEAVEEALKGGGSSAPEGVAKADWERVLEARREEKKDIESLRRLGPLAQEGESIITVDEVLTRNQEKGVKFQEVTTARVVTAEGYRYLSGERETVQKVLRAIFHLEEGASHEVTFISDGARWIREFFTTVTSEFEEFQGKMILDWYHLKKKIHLLASMIARSKEAKKALERKVYSALWRGQPEDAIKFLQEYFPQAKNEEKLQELIVYLQKRISILPDYGERHRKRHFIGSGHVEKANDLIVAQRQKRQGMSWKSKTSHALAALKTLRLNQGWSNYWQQGQGLALVET